MILGSKVGNGLLSRFTRAVGTITIFSTSDKTMRLNYKEFSAENQD